LLDEFLRGIATMKLPQSSALLQDEHSRISFGSVVFTKAGS